MKKFKMLNWQFLRFLVLLRLICICYHFVTIFTLLISLFTLPSSGRICFSYFWFSSFHSSFSYLSSVFSYFFHLYTCLTFRPCNSLFPSLFSFFPLLHLFLIVLLWLPILFSLVHLFLLFSNDFHNFSLISSSVFLSLCNLHLNLPISFQFTSLQSNSEWKHCINVV